MDDLPAGTRRVFGLPREREKAVEVLNRCYGSNLLDLSELEARLALVENAATLDDLDRVMADIPAEHRTDVRDSGPCLTEGESVVCRLNSMKKGGRVLLTRRLNLDVSMGTLVLDYRGLTLPPGILEVNLKADLGTCRIRLPEGVEVENRLEENLSTFRETKGSGAPARTVLRLTGSVRMSTVRVSRPGWIDLWLSRRRDRLR